MSAGAARALLLVAATAAACGSAPSAGPQDALPRACMLTVAVTPATDDAHPLEAGALVKLELLDGGSPSSRGGTVTWSVSAGSLETRSGPSVNWKTPTDFLDFNPRKLTVTAQAAGLTDCPDQSPFLDVSVAWPDYRRTVVIYNPMQQGSEGVARHYAAFRKIPDNQLCAVPYADMTTVAGADFSAFADAVMVCVNAVGSQVGFLAPVWGVPYKLAGRIVDLQTHKPTTVSLDAVLAFGRAAADQTVAVDPSPFFQTYELSSGRYPEPLPWGSLRFVYGSDYFLVARLDGVDAQAAIDLIDRTEQAEMLARAGMLAGTVYVDGKLGPSHPVDPARGSEGWGEDEIAGVQTVFEADMRYPVVADYDPAEFGTAPAMLTAPDALYYAGWYSFGHYNDVFTWKPGAIGGHLDSCSACDIRGSVDWSAVALQRGITATFGAVNEPYVIGLPAYDLFFYLLLQGASFAEAGYEASPLAAWMMVFVGDPIYRPYAPR